MRRCLFRSILTISILNAFHFYSFLTINHIRLIPKIEQNNQSIDVNDDDNGAGMITSSERLALAGSFYRLVIYRNSYLFKYTVINNLSQYTTAAE